MVLFWHSGNIPNSLYSMCMATQIDAYDSFFPAAFLIFAFGTLNCPHVDVHFWCPPGFAHIQSVGSERPRLGSEDPMRHKIPPLSFGVSGN